MSEFYKFKNALQKQFDKLSEHELFVTNVGKDDLWNTYLDSFPEGTNNIFRERREYDCQCCRQFIRSCGNVVAVINNKLHSIWDIRVDVDHYQIVADTMSKLVKSKKIENIFLSETKKLGTDFNHQEQENGHIVKWDHFYYELQNKFVSGQVAWVSSECRSGKEVFKRSLEEITVEAAETVIELIEQKSLYRGEEHKSTVELFIKCKREFDNIKSAKEKDYYCWLTPLKAYHAARIRNTVIGTLLTDISEGRGLDEAVRLFESKVAPNNYKRPSAVITKNMIDNAQKKVKELDIEDSLSRRYAITEDITINNVLFADRSSKKIMNVFDKLKAETPVNIKNLNKVDSVNIETFIETILPKSSNMELMFENKHTNNLMSLISPTYAESKNILKWDNNFSWAYNGEVADSMKQRVKKAGGKIDGVLRFSIQWNDGDNNQNDFDAHCKEPNGNLIYYGKKRSSTTGALDVDIINPKNKIAVENITWYDINSMHEGKYTFLVHNYNHCGGRTGFTAEIEYDGQIYSYEYGKELKRSEKVVVAEIEFSKSKGIKFIKSLPATHAKKEMWGINTQVFHKVKMVMNSPNHWDGNKTGNKHYFFMLENCLNPESARGFFNEFLNENLNSHRKVFEVLGSKMKVEKSNNQLSGLGFSSTKRNSILCKVTGSFNRIIKINF